MIKSFLLALVASASLAVAQDFSLTVYSSSEQRVPDWQFEEETPGFGVIREIRSIELQNGENTVSFTDVAGGIDPTTLSFRSMTAPDSTSVLEQNFEYDVLDAQKLLEKYIGRNIIVLRRLAQNEAPQPVEGKLLATDGNTMVLQTTDTKQPVTIMSRYGNEIAGITLADSANLITKPTLVWKIATTRAGKHDVQVTYQADGIAWRADYNLVVNQKETAVDVSAWVTLANQSGASYPNAKLKLVAGDVQRMIRRPRYRSGGGGGGAFGGGAPDEGFQEKSFFEYHLYTLGRPTSIANNSTKQIELFPPHSDVAVDKTYVYYGAPAEQRTYIATNPQTDRRLGIESNRKVDIYVSLHNSEKNGMGMPLPGGRVRVYKRDDADGSLEFIGEDLIQHTPRDERVLVKLGSAFDVVGERRQTNLTINDAGNELVETFEIKLRNHKKEPVRVIVKENLYRWTNWEITQSSDKHEKQDYRTIHIPVDVAADGEKVVTYTVKYTW